MTFWIIEENQIIMFLVFWRKKLSHFWTYDELKAALKHITRERERWEKAVHWKWTLHECSSACADEWVRVSERAKEREKQTDGNVLAYKLEIR